MFRWSFGPKKQGHKSRRRLTHDVDVPIFGDSARLLDRTPLTGFPRRQSYKDAQNSSRTPKHIKIGPRGFVLEVLAHDAH